ncbi:MAG TPA: carbonic anhydrase [Terriglobales bacterium]|nr:carbonic anhydrase [Terriglobales bacterium]
MVSLELASLKYAFDQWGATALVVLGHTKCGAGTAACSGEKMPVPNLQAWVGIRLSRLLRK